MSAELAKLRYLPLPRWTAAVVIGVIVLVAAILLIAPPSNPARYIDVPGIAGDVVYSIAVIVLAVWIATLEFGAGTLQRTLTAETNRNHVLLAKLATALLATAALGVAVALAGYGLIDLAAAHAGADVETARLAKTMFGLVPAGVAYAALGFGFGLLVRSLGGGITLSLAWVFVADQALTIIPAIEGYTFGQLTQDVTNHITALGETENSLGVAIAGSLVWVVVITLPGWLMFLRGDLK